MNTETKYQLTEADSNYLRDTYMYHSPKEDQLPRYKTLRDSAGYLAGVILMNCPSSRERSLALTHLQEVVMFANASIAINEK